MATPWPGAEPGDSHGHLLNDGKVLIAAGLSYGGIGIFFGSLDPAELYESHHLQAAPVLLLRVYVPNPNMH